MPKVSIITITYNAEKVLERSILSIIGQSYGDFEFIVIDGNSQDQTLQICEKYQSHIAQLISEKDEGIYDAMNKGLALAKGDFVWYINAGDEIAEKNTLNEIFNELGAEADLIYGDAFFVNDENKIRGLRSEITPHKLKPKIKWQDLKFGMLVCHQSLLVKREIAPKYILDNLSADIDWEIKCFKASKHPHYCSYPISRYLEGGISNQQLSKSLKDRFKVLAYHFGIFPTLLNHIIIAIRGIIKIITTKSKYW